MAAVQMQPPLWPHRSLTQRGFVWFLGATAALIALPLLAMLGSPVLWALLPFFAATLAGIWLALRKNGRDRHIVEELVLTRPASPSPATAPAAASRNGRPTPTGCA